MDNYSHIQPKNWGNFQHYKNRSPSWIKLHKSLLDNYDYQCLQLASKALAPMLWLLASEYDDGKIPYVLDRLSFRLRADEKTVSSAVSDLIKRDFFVCYQDASGLLAECLPREEKSREYKKEENTAKKQKAPLALTRFAEFWTQYPRKADKAKAEQSWSKQSLDNLADDVIRGAVSYAKSKIGTEPQFIALPSTWLNGKRWQDENTIQPPDKPPPKTEKEQAELTEREKAERVKYQAQHEARMKKLLEAMKP